MSLASDYRRQFGWRDWPRVLAAIPDVRGQVVLDLGCGIGDQAAVLARRGARVIGIDVNEELLSEARSRSIEHAEFRNHDLRALPDLGVIADGLWSSFTAAYFPDLAPVLEAWARQLRPGGWIALTEIDDLFGHEPLTPTTRTILDAYARDALSAKRYDFHGGRKLERHLEQAGFAVSRVLTLEDRELSFQGPADAEVVEAWTARLERMEPLRALAGAGFDALRDDFLGCLERPDHRCDAKVYCCVAIR